MKKLVIAAITALLLLFSLSTLTLGQTLPLDVWEPMKRFLGDWKGDGVGTPGVGNYERSYKFVLNAKYIEIRNKATYRPQPKNPKGEVHEDVGYISYDKIRKKFILRQFHIEGFVNQFVLESISSDSKRIVFLSESIENIPIGWRARETYQITNEKELMEIFELAAPNRDFEVYSKVILKKLR